MFKSKDKEVVYYAPNDEAVTEAIVRCKVLGAEYNLGHLTLAQGQDSVSMLLIEIKTNKRYHRHIKHYAGLKTIKLKYT
jgi:hypothetical protein